jgi:hypothetical protein
MAKGAFSSVIIGAALALSGIMFDANWALYIGAFFFGSGLLYIVRGRF